MKSESYMTRSRGSKELVDLIVEAVDFVDFRKEKITVIWVRSTYKF